MQQKNSVSPLTLLELSKLTKAQLIGDPALRITGVNDLKEASHSEASFLANFKYQSLLKESHAGVICIDDDTPILLGKNYLVSSDPSKTFQQIARYFLSQDDHFSGFEGIHPSAIIHPKAHIASDVTIGPLAVIDEEAVISSGTFIGAHVCVGKSSQIGKSCFLYPGSIVRERCILHDRVILQPGAVIGSCGFGYLTDEKGFPMKLEQFGIVVLEDDVEIGANTTVDRARFKETRIRKGSKIDNLVQIAHNVEIGPQNMIAAQTGIAGSSKTGKNVLMGGQVGIVGHLSIADYSMIATRGGVSKTLSKPDKYAGSPVIPLSDYNRQQVLLRQIHKFVKKIEELEEKIADLQAKVPL